MTSGPPSIEPESPFAGLQWRFILRGALLDLLLTLLTTLPLYLYYAGPEFFAEDPAVADRATRQAYASFGFNLLSLVLGLLCTGIGAFFAAHRAQSYQVRHGGWVAVVSVLLVLPFLFLPGALDVRQPLWVELCGYIGTLPAGLLGGYLAARVADEAA